MANNLSLPTDLTLQRQRGHFVEMEMSVGARVRTENTSIPSASSSRGLIVERSVERCARNISRSLPIVARPKESFERGLFRGASKICITDGVYMSRYAVLYVTCSAPLQANAMYWLPDVSKIQITRHSSSNDPS